MATRSASRAVRLHLPTQRTPLEDVVRLAIEQLGVPPAQPDWDRLLQRSRERFHAARTRT